MSKNSVMDLKSPFSFLTFIIIVPALFLFLFLLFKFVKVRRSKSGKHSIVKKKLPGPFKLVLIGKFLQSKAAGPLLQHRILKDLAMKHGPLMHLQVGEWSSVVVSSPRLAKEVLKTHDLAMGSRPTLPVLQIISYNYSDIAFGPSSDYWRQMRKLCTIELLTAKKVRSFCTIREEEVWNLIKSIDHLSCSSTVFDLTEKFDSLTNNIVCRSTIGYRCKDQESFLECIKELGSFTSTLTVADLFPSFKFLHFIGGMRPKIRKLHRKIDRIIDSIVHERLEKGNISVVTRDQEDLLDVLIRLKDDEGLSLDNLKAIILDMFLAGTDTSSTIMEWAMAEMLRNPRVMKKAQSEVRQALKGKKVVHEIDIKELSYLKLVIKETLRLHPPAPLLLPRECREESQLDGCTIPVGTRIAINVWAIGRDPEYWDNAEIFYPERFENNGVDFLGNNYEFIPFGGGRRMCPGITFGLAIVELALAQLLYHFNYELPNGMKPEYIDMSENCEFTLRRRHKLYVTAIPQTL